MPPIFGRAFRNGNEYEDIDGYGYGATNHWSRPYIVRENGSHPEHQECFYGGWGEQSKELLDERIRKAYPDAIFCETEEEEQKWLLLI